MPRIGMSGVRRRFIVIVIRVAFLVMVPLGAVLDFLLQLDGRDTRGVVKDHFAAELGGANQDRETEERNELEDPVLQSRLLEAAPQLPRQYDRED
ncbi:MAG TPA: hypothetical protein VFP39_03050, partial [Gemmatimonadales bacterium]|nr:hypothetical protein [Gemmatimonadales bacterium]